MNKFNGKSVKSTILVDENQDRKSVFSLNDYRHNLRTKEECDLHSSKVSQAPKEFITWNSGSSNYNPKLKWDTKASSLEYNRRR